MTFKMNDSRLRAALKRIVLARHLNDPETFVVEELGLRHGAARIDIAVINGAIHGFELKSDCDTLKRLPDQMAVFNSVLDRMTIVVGTRHLDQTMHVVPRWWGVKTAIVGPRGGISFSDVRRPANNPSPDAVAIAKLFWRQEALDLVNELGAATGIRSKPRRVIYNRLAEVMELEALRARVRQQLRSRTDWRSAEQPASCDG